MKLQRLRLHRFTAFEDAAFEFAPGVNVFIGENGAGKSHVLKLAYAIQEALRHVYEPTAGPRPRRATYESPTAAITTMLQEVFLPDSIGRLVRRGVGRRKATLEFEWSDGHVSVEITSLGRVNARAKGDFQSLERAVFVPPREVLSIFPGFISSWEHRESSFDRTYYDLALALDAKPLRGPRDEIRRGLLEPIERALGGSIVLSNGKFYVRLADGNMEAPLLAEGLRKLGMIAYLAINGSLTSRGTLFWDEPEANLNPKLARLTAGVMGVLAKSDVQVFCATHDYVLASELSLRSERDEAIRRGNRFFGLLRSEDGVSVESKELFTELQSNPILEALSELHDRELETDLSSESKDG